MNELNDYAMITTIAVVLLAVGQIIMAAVVTVVVFKIMKLINTLNYSAEQGKEFIASLRNQQQKGSSPLKMLIFAAKRFGSLRKRRKV